jgi:hypothetical protein
MNTKIILFLIVLLVIGYVFTTSIENFSFEDGMLVFTRLNGSLIKKYKINSIYTISDKDVQNLFKKDNTIRVFIPPNHSANIIYKLKNGGYTRTVELPEGAHDLQYNFKNDKEVIDQIESRIVSPYTSNKILVVNRAGETLFTLNDDSSINWSTIYTDYGLDDYYVVYPSGRRMYYRKYKSYPRHRYYRKRPGTPPRRRVI